MPHCPTCRCGEPDEQERARAAMTEYHELCEACGVVKAKRLLHCERCGFTKTKAENVRAFHTHKKERIMQRLKVLAVLVAVLFLPVLADAFTCANTTSCTVTATYTEPKVNANGTPIDDLKETVLILSVNGTASNPLVTPATSTTGGGVITKTATVAAPSCKSTKVDGTAAAIDTVNAPSVSTPATLTIDRTKDAGCEPVPATNFTLI